MEPLHYAKVSLKSKKVKKSHLTV